jgi:hypothetical protein
VLTELDGGAKPAFLSLLHLTLVDAIAFCVGPISPLTAVLVNVFTPWLLGLAFLPALWLALRLAPRLQGALALPGPRRLGRPSVVDPVSGRMPAPRRVTAPRWSGRAPRNRGGVVDRSSAAAL